MFIISDRVKETSTTSGSGSISLNGAYGAFQTFLDGIGDGSTTYYTIENNARWEVGQGSYDAATNSLSRDVIFSSSQGDQKINLQGTSTVFCTLPAQKAFIKDPNFNVIVNDLIASGEANVSTLTANDVQVSGGSNLVGLVNFGDNAVVSGDLSVLGNADFKGVSGEFLTLVRDNSAGNFFHAYKDDGAKQTVSLWVDENSSPMWRLGLKTTPLDQNATPTFAYVFGRDGLVGQLSDVDNYFSLSDTLGFSVQHDGNLIFRASSSTGVYIDGKSALYPAFTIQGAPLNVEDLQRWEQHTGNVLSVIDSGGKLGILTDSPIYELDVNGSGRLESIFLTSGIYFQDGTFQSTANDGGVSVSDIEAVSGIAAYSSGIAEQNTSDILTVSGLIGDSDVAIFASGLAVQNEIDIVTVSGWARDYVDSQDHSAASVSGWAEATFLTADDDSYVSGIAVYASGHTLQSITDNGATTDNSITINNNLTAENLFGDLYGPIVFECKNDTGSQINAGTPVYVSGYFSSNGKPLISPASGNDPTKMPAIGLLANDLADEAEGHVHVFGEVPRIDTSSFTVGQTVYVAPNGGLTNTRPSGVDELVQNIGRVLRSDANQGKILLLGPGRTNDVPNSGTFAQLSVDNKDVLSEIAAVSGFARDYVDSQDHSAVAVSGSLQPQITQNTNDIVTVSGLLGSAGSTSGIVFEKSGSNDEYRIGTIFIDSDGTEQVVRATDFNGGYLRLEVARFSPAVSAAGQSRNWDQPVTQWTVTVDNPTDFTTNYVSGVKSPLTGITGSVTSDVTLYSTTGPSVTPGGGVDWTQTFSTDGDSPIYSSTNDLTGGSASATVSFLDKNQATISETATITFNWSTASNSIAFANLSGKNFLDRHTTTTYNLTINNISDLSNTSTVITTNAGVLSNSSDDGTITFTTPIHKDNNSGRTITATTDFTRPATVTGTEYTSQDVSSDSNITVTFTYPSFYIFTSSTSNPPSRADIVDGFDFDSANITELSNELKVINQYINNPDSIPKCWWFAVRSAASQPTTFKTGSDASLLVGVTPTETTVDLEPDIAPVGYNAEEYKLYGITLNPGNTYVQIS